MINNKNGGYIKFNLSLLTFIRGYLIMKKMLLGIVQICAIKLFGIQPTNDSN